MGRHGREPAGVAGTDPEGPRQPGRLGDGREVRHQPAGARREARADPAADRRQDDARRRDSRQLIPSPSFMQRRYP